MEIITSRILILNILKDYKIYYKSNKYNEDIDFDEKYIKLSELNLENAKIEWIDDIMGNDSWTHIQCSECRKSSEWVIMLGKYTEDYDDCSCYLCRECFNKAIKMVDENERSNKPR